MIGERRVVFDLSGLAGIDGSGQKMLSEWSCRGVLLGATSHEARERLQSMTNQPVTVHLTTHGFSNGMTEVGYRLPARKPGELNSLVDPEGFLEQLASLRSGAEQRLEIERKAGR